MNRNTGIEYELAAGLALIRGLSIQGPKARALAGQIPAFEKAERVAEVAARLEEAELASVLQSRLHLQSVSDLDLISQDDSTPGDLLLFTPDRYPHEVSVSVKYGTGVSRNPTGRLFVSAAFIEEKERELGEAAVPAFIAEMTGAYGPAPNWFRKRKTSETAARFVESIAGEVCGEWSGLQPFWRRYIMRSCLQYESAKPYVTLLIRRGGAQFDLPDHSRSERSLMDVDHLEIVPSPTSRHDVIFVHRRHGPAGKMQIKFNNGFLERARKGRHGGEIDLGHAILARPGKPFSSWNFELVDPSPLGADGRLGLRW